MKTKAGMLVAGACGGLVLALTQCFSPTLPACSYQCAMDEPRCPDDYECRDDGLCHLKGNTQACNFDLSSPDLARASSGDMQTSDLPGDAGRD